jgi:Cdc6-like AAA superfamily ATPase
MKLEPHQALLITGYRGSGKTYFANNVVLPAHETAAVWDPHANFDVAYYEPGKVPAYAQKWGYRAAFLDAKAYGAAFSSFVTEAFKRRPQVIIVDEVALLVTRYKSAEDLLVTLATQSRHAGAAFVAIAQRAYMVPPSVRSQCSEYVSFQQSAQNDIRCIERDTETAPLECPAAPLAKCQAPEQCLKHLPRGKFFHATIRG